MSYPINIKSSLTKMSNIYGTDEKALMMVKLALEMANEAYLQGRKDALKEEKAV